MNGSLVLSNANRLPAPCTESGVTRGRGAREGGREGIDGATGRGHKEGGGSFLLP